MFFQLGTSPESIANWVKAQVSALPDVKYGWDVEVRPHKKQRTIRQNRFLMQVCANIVKFYHETGFIPEGCLRREMKTQGQKEFWKDHFGVLETHTMSTTELSEFIDKIQAEMVQQTGGEYEILTTDQLELSEAYL